ncbi:MAG: MFS transporter [Gemmatimonadetes bacterium]|nr:MFS transporter [Gemmatimonadota bacterium]NNM03553.1 MFS transporter [Gemmatimonadota bacterium]
MLDGTAKFLKTEPEVIALSFARMADALGNSLLIIILPLYIAAQPSPWEGLPTELLVGIAISLYGFLFALAQPFAGAASDRAGKRKPFILAGLLLMTLATLGFMFVHQYLWIIVLRCLQGLGVALIIPSVLALISGVTEKRNRGNAMGVYSTFRMIGFASGPLIAGILQVRFGFNATFLVGAAFLLAALILVQVTVKERPASEDEPGVESRAASPDAGAGPPPAGGLPSTTLLALMVSTIVLASSLSMISALENEFNDRLSQTAIGFGVAFSALTVSRLFVQIPIGRLSDRIGRKRLIIGGMVALAPLTVLFGFVTSTLQLVGLRVLQGVATAGVAAPAFALAGDLAKKGGEGREMSFVTMGFGLGLGVGPLLAGGLAGFIGFRIPFYVVGGLSLAAAVMVWLWAEESIAPGEWAVDEVGSA